MDEKTLTVRLVFASLANQGAKNRCYFCMEIIFIDFLGHGNSDRIKEFSPRLWEEEARQTIALLEHLQLGKVNLVGTSGGAWVAINAALERPELVDRVDFIEEYGVIARETGAKIHVFSEGRHPAILSNEEQSAEIICKFLE